MGELAGTRISFAVLANQLAKIGPLPARVGQQRVRASEGGHAALRGGGEFVHGGRSRFSAACTS